nr:putative type VI secretion system effector [Acinetobacter lanii]
MSLKQTDQIIEKLSKRLFIVEGEVTDLLTSETLQNLNTNNHNTTGAIAVGSALVGQIGNAALASFAASDKGIEVSDFALEVTDQEGLKHYFTGCFPVVVFQKGDTVKVIAEPDNEKYARAAAIIDQKKSYIWTAQEVVKGRLRYRIFGMKGGLFFGFLGVMTFCLFAIFDGDALSILLYPPVFYSLLSCLVA